MDPYWIGVDLGGTKMLALLCDSQFQVVARARKKTRGQEGLQAVLQRMTALVQELVAQGGLPLKKIQGVGIGCPSPVNLATGVVVDAVNLGWKDVPLKQLLTDLWELPVQVLNDVDAGLYGEYRFGAAKGARCAAGIFPGTGIGGACIYEGKILHGRERSGMEVGHLTVLPDGPRCGCGKRGCLEAVASRLAIAAEVARAAYRGEAPWILKKAGTSVGEIRSGVLAEAIRQGEQVVQEIVRHAARYLGLAAGQLVTLLGPDVVVLGGRAGGSSGTDPCAGG